MLSHGFFFKWDFFKKIPCKEMENKKNAQTHWHGEDGMGGLVRTQHVFTYVYTYIHAYKNIHTYLNE
jgi:hypothetical protein